MSHVINVEDHGTIVLVFLNDRPQPVAFDRRMFRNMAFSRDGNLKGECHVEGEAGEQTLAFDENPWDEAIEDEPC